MPDSKSKIIVTIFGADKIGIVAAITIPSLIPFLLLY